MSSLQPENIRAESLTIEQKRRQAAGNDSAKGRKGRAASPWGRFPHVGSDSASMAHAAYKRKGKQA